MSGTRLFLAKIIEVGKKHNVVISSRLATLIHQDFRDSIKECLAYNGQVWPTGNETTDPLQVRLSYSWEGKPADLGSFSLMYGAKSNFHSLSSTGTTVQARTKPVSLDLTLARKSRSDLQQLSEESSIFVCWDIQDGQTKKLP